MERIKQSLKNPFEYIKNLVIWLTVATLVGVVGGIIGALFHLCVDFVSDFRSENNFILYFLPVGGLLIVAMYKAFRSNGKLDTDRIIRAAAGEDNVPIVMVPMIFLSTVITHLFGGSAGREGAALQIGGGIGYNLGKVFRFNSKDIRIISMAGMSSVFAALFGTPVTAAVFSIELISVGKMNFTAFLPCIIASCAAYYTSSAFGIAPMAFNLEINHTMTAAVLVKVIVLAICCAVLGIVFCTAIAKCEKYMNKLIPSCYLRAFIGGAIIVLLTVLVGTYDYNGAGTEVIMRAISGKARVTDFIFKIIFTSVTIAAGFKGGEIIPSLFIGSTFGCVMAPILGIDPSLAAAIAMISVFCSVVNCPVASIFLSVELFGADGILFFGVACAISYIMSGYFGLYKSQKFVYSKLTSRRTRENINNEL